eukprot:TRINITY_DN6714_c0_g1_i1.p1 TRINITY_DN6714_c0_g1~~TRINITY_DN6714_c0_g1_i1.p1  ORF type:complete len:168 (-),score=29.01 TRINITY_DN6714_c0_g1_i1:77-580(-)
MKSILLLASFFLCALSTSVITYSWKDKTNCKGTPTSAEFHILDKCFNANYWIEKSSWKFGTDPAKNITTVTIWGTSDCKGKPSRVSSYGNYFTNCTYGRQSFVSDSNLFPTTDKDQITETQINRQFTCTGPVSSGSITYENGFVTMCQENDRAMTTYKTGAGWDLPK